MLVFQGGGALGAYQAGVYQALHEAGIEPDWIIGTSIGAINAGLIAGNRHADRLGALTEFWQRMAHKSLWSAGTLWPQTSQSLSYWQTLGMGIPGFFAPNPMAFWGTRVVLGADRAGYYSTAPLEKTLTELVDFSLHQPLQAAADGGRGARAHEPHDLLRRPRHRDRRQAHHGVGRVAAGVPGGPHRR